MLLLGVGPDQHQGVSGSFAVEPWPPGASDNFLAPMKHYLLSSPPLTGHDSAKPLASGQWVKHVLEIKSMWLNILLDEGRFNHVCLRALLHQAIKHASLECPVVEVGSRSLLGFSIATITVVSKCR